MLKGEKYIMTTLRTWLMKISPSCRIVCASSPLASKYSDKSVHTKSNMDFAKLKTTLYFVLILFGGILFSLSLIYFCTKYKIDASSEMTINEANCTKKFNEYPKFEDNGGYFLSKQTISEIRTRVKTFIYRVAPKLVIRPMNLCARNVFFRPVKKIYVDRYENDKKPFVNDYTSVDKNASLTTVLVYSEDEIEDKVVSEEMLIVVFCCFILQMLSIILTVFIVISILRDQYLPKNAPPKIIDAAVWRSDLSDGNHVRFPDIHVKIGSAYALSSNTVPT